MSLDVVTRSQRDAIRSNFPQGAIISGTPYYYVQDRLGSVRELVSANGSVVSQYDYDPYGVQTTLSGRVSSDIGYAVLFVPAGTGFGFALARAYDVANGRWLNRDPIAEAGGVNLYAYVGGDPVDMRDPLGLWTVNIGITVSGQLGSIAVSFSGGVADDGEGNVATYGVVGGAGLGVEGSAGVSLGASNAQTAYDLSGPFAQASVDVGAGPDVGASVYTGQASVGSPIVGGELTGGAGFGVGASAGGSCASIFPMGQLPGPIPQGSGCQ